MKRSTRTSLIVGLLAATAMGVTGCSATAQGTGDKEAGADDVQKLVVATSGNPKPYTYLGDGDKLTGYDIEILKLVDERLDDIEFEFQVADFPALFAGLDAGRFNIVANNLSATEERRQKYDFADPITEAQFGIVQSDKAADVTSLSDLAGKKTYGEPGLNYTRILEKYNEEHPDAKINIDYTELDLQSQYNNLATGSVDFIFNERVVFNGYGKSAGLPVKFSELNGEQLSKEYGTNLFSAYAFSKQTPNVDKVVAEVNGVIADLAKEGKLTELSKSFFDGLDVSPRATN